MCFVPDNDIAVYVNNGTYFAAQDELYFLQPKETFHQQINPRNEAAALSGLLDQLSKQPGQSMQGVFFCIALQVVIVRSWYVTLRAISGV